MNGVPKNKEKPVETSPSPSPVNNLDDSIAAPSPADGGIQGWLRVVGCFFVFFITWGYASSYGVYQAYYQIDLLSSFSPGTISWIGTVQVALLGLTGIVSGPLFDRGYIRWLLITGSAMIVFGLFMLSLAKEYWQILLAQGVCVGLGSGILYVPSLSIVSTSFVKRRPLAIGTASCGSAIGGIVLPIMFRRLQPSIGFAWVNRIFGFMTLALSVFALILLRPDPNQHLRRPGPIIDVTALRDPPIVFLFFGFFFVFLGYWIPLFFITPYAQLSLRTSTTYAFDLLAILNGGSFLGRILPALFAQRFGPAVTVALGAMSLGILILAWLGIHNVAGITVWAVLIGFMSGLNVAIPSAVIPLLSPSRDVVGARTGMAWSGAAFAALIGSPIAGALVNTATNDYAHGQAFGGAASFFGGLLMIYPAVYIWRRDAKRRRDVEKVEEAAAHRALQPDDAGAVVEPARKFDNADLKSVEAKI